MQLARSISRSTFLHRRQPLNLGASPQLLRLCSSESQSSGDEFEEEFLRNLIPISTFQRTLLSIGSSIISLTDPYRGDMISCLGETTGDYATRYMMEKMENSPEGSQILRERPRINSRTVDLEKLKVFPEGTLGKCYSNFLEDNQVTPDSRLPVQFMNDVNLAYVLQRYREAHDFFHSILGMPTNILGEVTVKWVEAFQTRLPMCIGGAIFGPIRLMPKHRELYRKYCLPWAIETGKTSNFLLNLYFEKRFEQPVSEIRQELNIKPLILPKRRTK